MKKQEQKNKTVFHAAAALLAVLAVVLVLYGGGRWLEKRAEKPETRTQLPQADQETVEVDGVTYRKKSRLTTILVMGVDHDTQDSYEYRKAGQADFLRLVVLDDADKTVQQLQIDRDTMTPVTVLGLLGDRYEPVTEQICLGYAFGDGRQTSCEVTVEAVGNLLGGQTIDQYLAMGLDGISTLNDLAGGVTVTLEDDFSAIDPAMTKGTTLTLQGEQAETYVRSRRSVGVGTNEARMARQESYIRQLSVQLDSSHSSVPNLLNGGLTPRSYRRSRSGPGRGPSSMMRSMSHPILFLKPDSVYMRPSLVASTFLSLPQLSGCLNPRPRRERSTEKPSASIRSTNSPNDLHSGARPSISSLISATQLRTPRARMAISVGLIRTACPVSAPSISPARILRRRSDKSGSTPMPWRPAISCT